MDGFNIFRDSFRDRKNEKKKKITLKKAEKGKAS